MLGGGPERVPMGPASHGFQRPGGFAPFAGCLAGRPHRYVGVESGPARDVRPQILRIQCLVCSTSGVKAPRTTGSPSGSTPAASQPFRHGRATGSHVAYDLATSCPRRSSEGLGLPRQAVLTVSGSRRTSWPARLSVILEEPVLCRRKCGHHHCGQREAAADEGHG